MASGWAEVSTKYTPGTRVCWGSWDGVKRTGRVVADTRHIFAGHAENKILWVVGDGYPISSAGWIEESDVIGYEDIRQDIQLSLNRAEEHMEIVMQELGSAIANAKLLEDSEYRA